MTETFEQYLDWVVYQIYPKSFYDSNGDGIGDINGIAEKLEYIRSLGANAIWICPIYQSPQCDNGYDISDYREIQPEYGTMEDFERLVQKAHCMGIRVLMDLVANHTSSEHIWFREARKSRENPYHDYYYWAEKPLTDWKSVFGGSAWEYNEATGEYYLHSFAVGQPDVNWTNPKVRKEFADIVDFWADRGVDGFRCDVLDFISKDFQTGKMYNGPFLHDYLKELMDREKVRHLFTVGECQANEQSILAICGENRGELKCTFQFEHFNVGRKNGKFFPKEHSVGDAAAILKKWQSFSQEHDFLYTLLTDNHDNAWYNSRVGNDREYRYESATLLATMVYGLRGIPFIYQGQEIGAANSSFDDISNFDDIETLNYYREKLGEYSHEDIMKQLNFGSRDNPRRPMAWNGNENFGFTTAEKPWLPYASRSAEINVEKDLEQERSVLRYYRDLFAIRNRYSAFRRGDCLEVAGRDGCLIYERSYGDEHFLVVCNFEKENRIDGISESGELILSNYLLQNAEINRTYAPFEAAIYRMEEVCK